MSEWAGRLRDIIKCIFIDCGGAVAVEEPPVAEESRRIVDELSRRLDKMILDEGVDQWWLDRAVDNERRKIEEEGLTADSLNRAIFGRPLSSRRGEQGEGDYES
jgi:hypothetical protein